MAIVKRASHTHSQRLFLGNALNECNKPTRRVPNSLFMATLRWTLVAASMPRLFLLGCLRLFPTYRSPIAGKWQQSASGNCNCNTKSYTNFCLDSSLSDFVALEKREQSTHCRQVENFMANELQLPSFNPFSYPFVGYFHLGFKIS